MGPPSRTAPKILASLKKGEKSLWEIARLTGIQYATVQRSMMRLVKDGLVEGRWDDSQETRKSQKRLYRIKR
jgi:predicted ArsR family transcriptional regulator